MVEREKESEGETGRVRGRDLKREFGIVDSFWDKYSRDLEMSSMSRMHATWLKPIHIYLFTTKPSSIQGLQCILGWFHAFKLEIHLALSPPWLVIFSAIASSFPYPLSLPTSLHSHGYVRLDQTLYIPPWHPFPNPLPNRARSPYTNTWHFSSHCMCVAQHSYSAGLNMLLSIMVRDALMGILGRALEMVINKLCWKCKSCEIRTVQ